MAWARYTHANVSPSNPRAFAVCDRCGFVYNHYMLSWQYQWAGPKLQNLRILVCDTCMDVPQEQLRTIILPPDPIPIYNSRPGEFSAMVISSSPDEYATIVPSEISIQGTQDAMGTFTGVQPIVTETSSQPLLTEIAVTPSPSSSGYIPS